MPSHPHSRDLYTVEQLRAIERAALTALGISGEELMRRAASAALGSLRRHWPQVRQLRIYCGPGNNGGDGFLLAVLAREVGLQVELVALDARAHGDAALARSAWEAGGGHVQLWDAQCDLGETELHVDALYGIGLNRALEPSVAQLVEQINASGQPLLALDVPSGLNADSGHCPGAAIRADVTVTFIAGKRGLHTGRSADHVGVLELATLGVPEHVYAGVCPDAQLLVAASLPPRARYANKGSYGHVLVIGGDHGMAGAARMTGEAALRAGAGLVGVATRSGHVMAMNAARPEMMVQAVDEPPLLEPLLDWASVLAVGPGLGKGTWGHALWLIALGADKPLVLDADGLNLLVREPRKFGVPAVLTPHPGEAARLLGVTTPEIERDRFAAVRELARRYAAVVVLKGAGSLIADTDGRLDVCPWGNPGMASGGMGDLLTGIIAALLAQGCNAWQAACLGVGLHARAGDHAAQQGERGLLASDLLLPLRALGNGLPGAECEHE
ncbi:MAG TPA: NAD(P)H-hydrate dehydratase [Rhodanobacter sp.]|nr:NAD(P)H-hydrate dehydratase [Rhodanobacter sp.]